MSEFAGLSFLERVKRQIGVRLLAPASYTGPSFYHVHLRKTGGTSLNRMFIRAADVRDVDGVLDETARRFRCVADGKVFVAWNRYLINKGNYFFAHSHTPFHQLRLPETVFTFTCLREPVGRILSLYRMLRGYQQSENPHPAMRTQKQWLGSSFGDFLDRLPENELCHQLYMFSRRMHLPQALDVIGELNHVLFLQDFDADVRALARKTALPLVPEHSRKAAYSEEIAEHDVDRLREMVRKEDELVATARRDLAGDQG